MELQVKPNATESVLANARVLRTSKVKYAFEDFIETLANEERVAVRQHLVSQGQTYLPRNLYFNYETQVWILNERGTLE